MFRFILKIIIFGFIFFLFILAGFFIPDKASYENMHYSIHDKHSLLNQKEGNRIILLGGSNFSFGLYSPLIKEAFNKNVINASIHGGYGLKFMIDDIVPTIQENDIIVLSPEYANHFNNDFYGNEVLIQLIDIYPEGIKSLSLQQFYLHLGNFFKIAVLKWRTYISSYFKTPVDITLGAYERESFNKYGDVVSHWKQPNEVIKSKTITIDNFNKDALNYMNKFNKIVKERNARLFVTYPSLNRTSYNKSEKAIQKIDLILNETDLNLLGSPSKYSLHDSLYFDSHYHLNKEGQYLRTQLLIEDLKKHIN